MIVTRLIGGLGNQMFQYAAGRALALRRGTTLAIDRRGFEVYHTHHYGLFKFALDAVDANPALLPGAPRETRLSRIMRRLRPGPALQVYTERSFTFDPAVIELQDGTYLDGYWQSVRYFADADAAVRADFAIRTPPSADNAQWLARVAGSTSVALHIRRGDYVADARANSVHGTCPIDYYLRAVERLRERVAGIPEFYVFSDDPDWAEANLRLGYPTHFLRHNDKAADYEDLRLMSACRHAIIANSTFSWWAAWLNPHPDKTIIAPARWFRTDTLDDRDLIPQDWLRV